MLMSRKASEKRDFLGVFSLDTLPLESVYFPCNFICNTQPRNHPGEHWIAICKNEENIGFYFDSFGHPPSQEPFRKCLEFCEDWTYNNVPLQSPLTTACGQYTVAFLTLIGKGYQPFSIIEIFDQGDQETSDLLVTEYVQKVYDTYVPVTDYPFIFEQSVNYIFQ